MAIKSQNSLRPWRDCLSVGTIGTSLASLFVNAPSLSRVSHLTEDGSTTSDLDVTTSEAADLDGSFKFSNLPPCFVCRQQYLQHCASRQRLHRYWSSFTAIDLLTPSSQMELQDSNEKHTQASSVRSRGNISLMCRYHAEIAVRERSMSHENQRRSSLPLYWSQQEVSDNQLLENITPVVVFSTESGENCPITSPRVTDENKYNNNADQSGLPRQENNTLPAVDISRAKCEVWLRGWLTNDNNTP